MSTQDILTTYQKYFSQAWFLNISDVFITIGWGFATLLCYVVDGAEHLLNTAYSLVDFTSYAGIDQFFSRAEVRTVLVILFAAALCVLGYTLIFPKEDGSRPKVVQNLMLAVLVLCALPTFMTAMNSITLQGVEFLKPSTENLSNEILSSSVVDLKYLDMQGFDADYFGIQDGQVTANPNGYPPEVVRGIDPNEKMKFNMTGVNYPEAFKNKLTLDDGGNYSLTEIDENKFLSFDFTSYYYRYNIDFLSLYISLVATAIAMFFTAFKMVKLVFELVVHHFLAVFSSALDLTTGQRTKAILKSIGSIYVVIMLTVVMLKFYLLAHGYVTSHVPNSFVRAILLVFFAFAVVDGPNIIEKILGIDAGLSSGFQTIMGMYYGGRMALGGVKGAAHTVGKVGGAAAGGVKGFTSYIRNGLRNDRPTGSFAADGISNAAAVSQNAGNQSEISEQNSSNTRQDADHSQNQQNNAAHTGGDTVHTGSGDAGSLHADMARDLGQAAGDGSAADNLSGAEGKNPDLSTAEQNSPTGAKDPAAGVSPGGKSDTEKKKEMFSNSAFNKPTGSVSKGAAELLKNGMVTPLSQGSTKGGKPGISGGRDISSGAGTARRSSGAGGKNIDIWPDSHTGKSETGFVSSGASPTSPGTRSDGRRPYDPDHTPVKRANSGKAKSNGKGKE